MTIFDTDDRMALLTEEAHYYQPRLFALYGLSNNPEREILGWGMNFKSQHRTLFYLPGEEKTYHASSPDAVRKLFGRIADVRLIWLDEE